MPRVFLDDIIGTTSISLTDVSTNAMHPVGTICRAYRTGEVGIPDGGEEWVYLAGVASLAANDVVSYIGGITTRWAGTANSGAPLAVASSNPPQAGQFGWFCIQGITPINTSGTLASGNPVYWQAAATLQATASAGRQVLNAVAASANGVPSANKTLVSINRPFAQGAIT